MSARRSHDSRQAAEAAAGAGEGVHRASTREALEAVYRLRYQIYALELGKGFLRTVDDARGWIKDPEDEQDNVHVFYSGPTSAMTGSVRVQVWEPGGVPDEVFQRFSLQLFPGIQRYRVSEASRLVVSRDSRGGSTVAALAATAIDYVAAHHDVFVCFAYCCPGLIHAFMRLGFRPYPGLVIPNEDGIRLPMFMLASDLQWLKDVGSPLAPLLARRLGDGRALPDLSPFVQVARDVEGHYETDPQRVWDEVRARLQPGPATSSALLEGLTVEQAQVLCRCGFLMEVPADTVVMRQGLVERELYLALEGRYAILMEDLHLAELGPGDVLGEVSFFQEPGKRVATIRSLTPGRVMVLDRHFLERLLPAHAEVACRVLFNLGRIVSGHLAMALQAYIDGRQGVPAMPRRS